MNVSNQVNLDRVLGALAAGETLTIPGRGGWVMKVTCVKPGVEFDFKHVNPVADGGEKFFTYNTYGNPYGAGKVYNETTLGVSCRDCGVAIDGNIVGAVVVGDTDKVEDRLSWSNIVYAKSSSFSVGPDGKLIVNGSQYKGYLHAVFLADKNRIDGYVGVFRPTKPVGAVKVLEMEQLVLASLPTA
ncbi:MAG TPA: hypothetical protein VLK22_02190 [Candidatus Udaeobacter sp.]|nr:hypothetical protein [Candidatus Udaeobacter sp.]